MLFPLVLILSTLTALLGGYLLFKITRNYCVCLFEIMFLLFFVVRPYLVYSFEILTFDLKRFGVENDAVLTYAACGLIFSIVFHRTVYKLYQKPSLFFDGWFRICNFDRIRRLRFFAVLCFFTVLTYLVNALKFHSLGYFRQNLDSFEAGVNLQGGLWFLQILSWILIFPLIALVARNLDARPVKLFGLLLIAMVGFYLIARPSTRTETISLLAAVAAYSFSVGKIRINLTSLAIISGGVIALLVLLDALRQGNLQAGPEQVGILGWLIGAFQNLGPADNGMILIDYLKHHSWLYFRYLLASLSPLSLVPSALFPYKPRTDIEGVLTYKLFGFDLDASRYHEGGTLTYTVPVAGYADLGFLGVVVAALLYGFIFAFFLRGWRSKSTSVRFITMYYLILIIAGLRLSVEALMSTFYWVMLATWVLHVISNSNFFVVPFANSRAQGLQSSHDASNPG